MNTARRPARPAQRRIEARFSEAAGRKLLVPYLTAGDPNLDATLEMMHTLVRAGSDVIELGVPFSDPMADGPVIQAACERALKQNVTLSQVIDTVARFRTTDQSTPVVLMGYLNPVERMGYEQFAAAAAEAGVDGVLTVDMPPEESAALVAALDASGLDSIFLLSPTTPDARLQQVGSQAGGYLYYVALKGVTGAANLDVDEVARKVSHIKSMCVLPVAVGFGIRDASSAAAVSKSADAVVVGSVLVSLIAEHGQDRTRANEALYEVVSGMRQAMDQGLAT